MTQQTAQGTAAGRGAGATADLHSVLHSPGYVVLLVAAAVLGIPISLLAFGFLAAVHALENGVWQTLPQTLGWDTPPAWWPVLALGLAGVLVGLVVVFLPGRGGHVPATGMSGSPTEPRTLPGVLLAAGLSLALGAVLGPEAPLIALGSGTALLVADRTKLGSNPRARALVAAAGAAAAIAAIFGNPLVAAVLMLEIVGLGGQQLLLVMLPCLVSSGVGALVFTGLDSWTGLPTGTLKIPGFTASTPTVLELVWVIPIAAAIAAGMHAVMLLGRRTAALELSRTLVVTVAAGLVVGGLAALYAVTTGHSPVDVVLSGESLTPQLVAQPLNWSVAALAVLLVCKGLGYGVSLGAFRGGPVFPSISVGAIAGMLAGHLPGLGMSAGTAIGITAGAAAIMRMPVTSVLLAVLLLGPGGIPTMPLIMVAAVTAIVVVEMLDDRPKEAQRNRRSPAS